MPFYFEERDTTKAKELALDCVAQEIGVNKNDLEYKPKKGKKSIAVFFAIEFGALVRFDDDIDGPDELTPLPGTSVYMLNEIPGPGDTKDWVITIGVEYGFIDKK
ncbi:hypothetical protein OQA88_11988 [Cercophora sp. LCS_1]